jgi:hypothetical protein
MYACILETGRGFFEGGCAVERIGYLRLATHPHHGLPYI